LNAALLNSGFFQIRTSLPGLRVVRELDFLIAVRGCPAMCVSDNGTEQRPRRKLIEFDAQTTRLAPDIRFRFRCCASTTSTFGAGCFDGSYFP
jgi:hypothetical protein